LLQGSYGENGLLAFGFLSLVSDQPIHGSTTAGVGNEVHGRVATVFYLEYTVHQEISLNILTFIVFMWVSVAKSGRGQHRPIVACLSCSTPSSEYNAMGDCA